jgi:hypothetical protein
MFVTFSRSSGDVNVPLDCWPRMIRTTARDS